MSLKAFDKLIEEVLTEGYKAPADFLNASDAEIAEAEKKWAETCEQKFDTQTKKYVTSNPKGGAVILDMEAFHKAYDKAWSDLGVLELFKDDIPEKAVLDKVRWDRIKDLKGADKYEKRAISALKMLWGLSYNKSYRTAAEQRKYEKQKEEQAFIDYTLPNWSREIRDNIWDAKKAEIEAYGKQMIADILKNPTPEFAKFIDDVHNIWQDDANIYLAKIEMMPGFFVRLTNEQKHKVAESQSKEELKDYIKIAPDAMVELYFIWGDPTKSASENYSKYGIYGGRPLLSVSKITSADSMRKALENKQQAPIWNKSNHGIGSYDTLLTSTKKLKGEFDAKQAEEKRVAEFTNKISNLRGYDLLNKLADEHTTVHILYVDPEYTDVFRVSKNRARSLVTDQELTEFPPICIPFAVIVDYNRTENEGNILAYRHWWNTYYSWNSEIIDELGMLGPDLSDLRNPLSETSVKTFDRAKAQQYPAEFVVDFDFDSWAERTTTTYAD